MPCLADIAAVGSKLKSLSSKAISVLHSFIFEQKSDRNNRKRLREFTGFKFETGSDEYLAKIKYGIEKLSDGDVISMCNVLGINYEGKKNELLEQITNSLIDFKMLESEVEDSELDDETYSGKKIQDNVSGDSDVGLNSQNDISIERETNGKYFTLSYRDVQDSIMPFDGSGKQSINKWLSNFEDTASLFHWSDLQKLIFAERSLMGLAKLFVQSEKIFKTWGSLKRALKGEFAESFTSAQLHEMLSKRTIKRDESLQEYFLIMKDIAARGQIEDEALFHYVINGIQDDERNKIPLYGAKNITEFKEKLKIYETIIKKNTLGHGFKPRSEARTRVDLVRKPEYSRRSGGPDNRPLRCYNCGKQGHRSKDCEMKALGSKCFKCSKYGHKSYDCDSVSHSQRDTPGTSQMKVTTVSIAKNNLPYKEVTINSVRITSLVDTGSQATLIREMTLRELKIEMVQDSSVILKGFGHNEIKTLGYAQVIVAIDGEEFPSTILVVPDTAMNVAIIIGNDILSQAEVTINEEGVKFKKKLQTLFLAEINVIEKPEPTFDHIKDEVVRKNVEDCVNSYVPKKSKTTDIKMTISLKEGSPIFHRPRRLPHAYQKIVESQIEEWLRDGIIEESSSEYASPVVVARKKDGSPRICIDYRKINRLIVKDRYPLPLIEDQLDRLSAAKLFSMIDLKNGFFHVPVDEESRRFTSFVIHNGQYQFCKVPFGLCNSPSVFQRFINFIFRKHARDGIALLYLDDIIIPASNSQEALERLMVVLHTASEYGLEINMKKSHFMLPRVEFLGYVVEDGQIYPNEDKMVAVVNFPPLKTLKDVQSFLGLTGYFRKFIPDYSIIAKPLSDMLRKDENFCFSTNQRLAVERLKRILADTPVLRIYNPEYRTELHTDASLHGYGAVLLQKSPTDEKFHPVYYMSKKTTDAEKKYISYELEVLAIVTALKKFRVYLLGIDFLIVTDCAAFERTMHKKDLATRVARWALLLEEFNYRIEHRQGTQMRHVDALSRYPVMIITLSDTVIKIQESQKNDSEANAIFEILKDKPYKDYFISNGMLYKSEDGKNLLVIPKQMQWEIIAEAHKRGHFASKRTQETIKQEYYIPGLEAKVHDYISNCIPCILANRKTGKPEGFLHPLMKEDTPLVTYHIDHLGPLESTNKKYKHILAIIDGFTKFVWLYPTKCTTTQEVISKLELQKKTFGNPLRIVSDRGTAFSSDEFQSYCKAEEIQHFQVTTGLPRANGQVECLNRTIIPVLTKFALDDPTKWYQYVENLQTVLNSTYQRSIGMTPFELLFGVKMRHPKQLMLQELLDQELLLQFQNDRNDLRESAKQQILEVQEENRKTYNKRRRKPLQYKIGDYVAIKRTQLSPGRKLKAKFLGPYKITKVKLNDTYDVQRVGQHEGPLSTSSCAEFLKPWASTNKL